MNLNDQLIAPFYMTMWIVLIFLVPAVTMGLFASEKANGTDELLYTSPIRVWEIVSGKFVAGFAFVAIMTGIVGFFPLILFIYGDPEVGKTLSGLLGLLLVSMAYVGVGALASSITRNQLIAFVLTMVASSCRSVFRRTAEAAASGSVRRCATSQPAPISRRWSRV